MEAQAKEGSSYAMQSVIINAFIYVLSLDALWPTHTLSHTHTASHTLTHSENGGYWQLVHLRVLADLLRKSEVFKNIETFLLNLFL